MSHKDYNLSNLPAEKAEGAGEFFWSLYEEGLAEKDRLGLHARWLENYRLFRGAHWDSQKQQFKYLSATRKAIINLLFANIQRTVANVTAKAPVAEVVDVEGIDDGADKVLSAQVRKWNNESEQTKSLSSSVLNMETYGITIEKAIYNVKAKKTDTVIVDPYAFVPAPGYYEEVNDCPYVCHAYPMPINQVEAMFNVSGVNAAPGKINDVLGREREDYKPIPTGTTAHTVNYPGNFSSNLQLTARDTQNDAGALALVVEIWVRDFTTRDDVDADGNHITVPKYPGGIRVVTVTNDGKLVLADRGNPNINPEIPREVSSTTYLYDHFPFYKSNSYEDTTNIWGFAAAEQVGDINLEIDEMMTRLSSYLKRVCLPPLILPKDCGVETKHINNRPGLILRPTGHAVSQGIRYLPVPNLPSNFFDALNLYISFFDRISQIEDADRGVAPNGVIAAQAIVALQERGAVMMRAKIRAVDFLVRQRGRCAISFFQNFGVDDVSIDIGEQQVVFSGIELIGRKFSYIVESGSTVAKTTLQTQEQAMALYERGAIDRQALLETLNFPGWKEIVERAGEGQVAQALQVLIQAGLPEEIAKQLHAELLQPQGGPGNTSQVSAPGETHQRPTVPPQVGEVNDI